jgi:hypothetical protein
LKRATDSVFAETLDNDLQEVGKMIHETDTTILPKIKEAAKRKSSWPRSGLLRGISARKNLYMGILLEFHENNKFRESACMSDVYVYNNIKFHVLKIHTNSLIMIATLRTQNSQGPGDLPRKDRLTLPVLPVIELRLLRLLPVLPPTECLLRLRPPPPPRSMILS